MEDKMEDQEESRSPINLSVSVEKLKLDEPSCSSGLASSHLENAVEAEAPVLLFSSRKWRLEAEWDATHIRSNLHALVTYTECNAELLTFCYQREMLGVDDIEAIDAEKTYSDKAHRFYKILQTRTNFYSILVEALQKSGQNAIVEILETGVVPPWLAQAKVEKILQNKDSEQNQLRLNPAGVGPSVGPIFDVIEPVPLFSGRKRELEELHQKVVRGGQRTVISQLTSISGLGGIGKTQLARRYVEKHRKDFDNNCVWIHAETENSLSESFRILARDKLGIPTRNADGTEKQIGSVVMDVFRYFQNKKSLFIFDNAEKTPWIKQFLPKATQPDAKYRPYIIMTSRSRDWERGVEVISLDKLDLPDAIGLVKKGLGLEENAAHDIAISNLMKRLQCFPLAIQQAISYIEYQQEMSEYVVSDYLKEFERRQEELLSFDEMNGDLLNDYNKTTLTTWRMTVEKIGLDSKYGKVALSILYAMAYLSPEKIKRNLFLHLEGVPSTEALFRAVNILVKYSMVRGEERQSLLSIHRLVQEVIRMESIVKGMEAEILEDAITILTESLETALESLQHFLSLYPFLWKYPEVVKKFEYLPNGIVKILHENMMHEEVVRIGMDACQKLVEIFGKDYEYVLNIQHIISMALSSLGRIDESICMTQSVLDNRKRLYGEFDDSTLSSMHNLGVTYFENGRYEEGYKHFEMVHNIYKRLDKPEYYPRYCRNCTNMAFALCSFGKAEEGLQILRDICKQPKIELDKTTSIIVRRVMGKCLIDLGEFSEALKVLKIDSDELVELSQAECGEMCDFLLMSSLALGKTGDYGQALDKRQQAFQLAVATFGEDHVRSITISSYVANNLARMGRHEEAIGLFDKAVSKMESLLGESNLEVAKIKVQLAESLMERGGNADLQRAVMLLTELKSKCLEQDWGEQQKQELFKHIDWIEKEIEKKTC